MSEEIEVLKEIRDELKKLNAKMEAKRPARKESVQLDGLPDIARIWNEWALEPFAKVQSMSTASTRYKAAVARWKEKPDEAYWVGAIRRLNGSDFCKGMNDRLWIADCDFLCRPDSAARILEGKYDKKEAPKKPEPKFVWNEELQAWQNVGSNV